MCDVVLRELVERLEMMQQCLLDEVPLLTPA
jgi:hypothetical protein